MNQRPDPRLLLVRSGSYLRDNQTSWDPVARRPLPHPHLSQPDSELSALEQTTLGVICSLTKLEVALPGPVGAVPLGSLWLV